jgi:hypothetical protein
MLISDGKHSTFLNIVVKILRRCYDTWFCHVKGAHVVVNFDDLPVLLVQA